MWLDMFAVPQVSPDHSGFLHEVGTGGGAAGGAAGCWI